MGLTVAAPDRKPRYVLSVEPVSNTVTVGRRESLSVAEIHCGEPTWCGQPVTGETHFDVQFRAHGDPVTAVVESDAKSIRAHLTAPAVGVAPGQTLALYEGTRVRGSATITATVGE